MAIGVGTTALVARSWGAGEHEEASRITSSSLMFGGLVGLAIMILGMLFSHQIAKCTGWMRPPHCWLHTIFSGWRPSSSASPSTSSSRAHCVRRQRVDAPAVRCGGNVVNLPLLYSFIFGKFGARAWVLPVHPSPRTINFVICGRSGFLWMRAKAHHQVRTGRLFPESTLCPLLRIGTPVALQQMVLQAGLLCS